MVIILYAFILYNKKHISINDNFFEIGGDSLAAAALFSYIEDGFGIQVPMNIFFKESTIKSLAIYIESSEKIKESLRFLVPVKASGYKEPLICVHTGDGEAVTYHHIGKFMEQNRPVYALRFDESSSLWQHPLTFRQIGEKYAEEIRKLDPYGPYHLCGTCFGGVLAFEIASILKSQGAVVKTLAMFDSVYNIGSRKYSKLFFNSFDEIRSKGIKQLIPLTLKKTNTMINLIKTKYKKNIYKESIEEQNNIQYQNVGKAAVLSYAHSVYTPEKYDGKIYYFSSKKDKSRGATAETYWSTMSDEFHVISMDCRHTEINDEFNSKFLAEKLSLIMEDTNV
jgi:thioesterase domain-containing protein/acyl carrier protein